MRIELIWLDDLIFRPLATKRKNGMSEPLELSAANLMNTKDRVLWPAFWLFILSVALYSRAISCEFVLWDDPDYVLRNRMVQSGLSFRGFQRAWMTFECANWHPLTWISLMLDYQLFGLRPWGFHLTNVLFHGLNSALVFLWLSGLSKRSCGRLGMGQAWLIAAVFAVHPVHVESVAWITERKDVLATFFGLLCLLAYNQWVSSPKFLWRAACFLLFLLSLCSKPLLVTLPCALLLVDFWPLGRWSLSNSEAAKAVEPMAAGIPERGFLHCAIEKWPLFLLSFASCVVTCWAQHQGGAVRPLTQVPFSERIPNAIVNYGSYLQIVSWPFRLCAFYPLGRNEWTDLQVVVTLGVLGFFSVGSIFLRRRCPGVLIGWLWFLGTLVPMIGLVQVGDQAIADRYLYVPLIGLAIAIVTGASLLLNRFQISSPVRWGMALCSIMLMSGLTWQQIGTWKNTDSLARHCLEVVPQSWNGHLLMASAHSEAGRINAAREEYELTLKLNPGARIARNNLAILLMSQGQFEAAVKQYQMGLDLDPTYSLMRMNFANALARNGALNDSLVQYETAACDLSDNLDLYRNYGTALILSGKPESAVPILEHAVELAPGDLTSQLRLAQSILNSSDAHSSRSLHSRELVENIAKMTGSAEAYLVLAEADLRSGNSAMSQKSCRMALDSAGKEGRSDLLQRGSSLMSKLEKSRQ
jgi:Tfp pilus assembly protein PilF